jgi:hypothetical protein
VVRLLKSEESSSIQDYLHFYQQLQVYGVPQTTLSFNNSLEGLIDFTKSVTVMAYYKERIHIKIRQGNLGIVMQDHRYATPEVEFGMIMI